MHVHAREQGLGIYVWVKCPWSVCGLIKLRLHVADVHVKDITLSALGKSGEIFEQFLDLALIDRGVSTILSFGAYFAKCLGCGHGLLHLCREVAVCLQLIGDNRVRDIASLPLNIYVVQILRPRLLEFIGNRNLYMYVTLACCIHYAQGHCMKLQIKNSAFEYIRKN